MSEIKVNKISPRSGTAFTLGDSGDTFTIPSGATINNQGTAVNFGATGSASWVTTVKTSSFTAVAGEGYFVNTTSGAITVTLPASPAAGAVVAVKDYANTWDTNACTLGRNGSNIGGLAIDSTLSIEGLAVTLVFVDATKGWLVTDSGLQNEAPGPQYIAATGGTVTCSGNFKIHTFTGPGTFCVSNAGNAAGSNSADYMVVAGGAGGGGGNAGSSLGAGGGGAGGYRESPGSVTSYTASPLGASPAAAIVLTAQGYTITVGSGGAGGAANQSGSNNGVNGSPASALSITSTGGGYGAGRSVGTEIGGPGGSGGGGANEKAGGTGNTPPVNPAQGKPGSAAGGASCASGSGGGAGTTVNMTTPREGVTGGAGVTSGITASSVTRAGGGGSGTSGNNPTTGAGGAGGGGAGGGPSFSDNGSNGTVNTGGAGGGATSSNSNPTNGGTGGTGGSGIVVIRYKFQN